MENLKSILLIPVILVGILFLWALAELAIYIILPIAILYGIICIINYIINDIRNDKHDQTGSIGNSSH